MLAAAAAAPDQLQDSTQSVLDFIAGQFNPDGGARCRSGRSDLYYTAFALTALHALGHTSPTNATTDYLSQTDCSALDLVHVTCLARCMALMPATDSDAPAILDRIAQHRAADGGFNATPNSDTGTVYDCFLALGAYQDMDADLPDTDQLVTCITNLRTRDGAFANDTRLRLGTTTATAAAVIVLHELGQPVPPTVTDWLFARCHPAGGFLATPKTPLPDLLSTATAIHALQACGLPLDDLREPCLDFLDALWTGHAFRGHSFDDIVDCEYTFYGLLTAGHLAHRP